MRKSTTLLICLLLVLLALGGAILFVKTAPEAERKRPPKRAPLVDIQQLTAGQQTVVLELTGTVVPAEEITLLAQVSGEIISMVPDFMEGGVINKGDEILQIEPIDYELALASAKSSLVKAQFDYKMELGRQDVAKREWELLKTDDATDLEKELALRIPHLASSEASLKAAEAALEKAELNLKRTHVTAPFDAVVLARNVNVGSQINTIGQQLAHLVGTGTYWVQVSIPVDRLDWITVPGSHVKLFSSSGAERTGTVIKRLGDLEERGRMARLLVEVSDPLCLQPEHADLKPLLLGEYVRAEVSGRVLDDTYSIPRNALREGGVIWLATAEDKLNIREVEVLWRDASNVLIQDGIAEGERLIVSDLTAAINGMDVNTSKDKPKGQADKKPADKE